MTDLDRAIAAAREAVARVDRECSRTDDDAYMVECARAAARLVDLLAALDAARGKSGNLLETLTSSTPIALPVPAFRLTWRDGQYRVSSPNIGDTDCYTAEQVERLIRYAAPPAAMAEPADNVTPMRQPRADLARLVESINAAVYANGDGLSVTEAIGALELAKLELLKEQEQ